MPYCYDYDKLGRLIYYKADARSGKKIRVKKTAVKGDPYPCSDMEGRRESRELRKYERARDRNVIRDLREEEYYNIPRIPGSTELRQMQDIEDLKAQIEANNQIMVQMGSNVLELNQQLKMLENRQRTAENTERRYVGKDELNSKINDYNSKLNDLNSKISELNSKNANSNSRINDLNSKFEGFSSQWQSLNNKMSDLEKNMILSDQIKERLDNIERVQQEQHNEDWEEVNLMIDENNNKLKSKLKNEIEEMKNKIKKVDTALALLNDQITNIKNADKNIDRNREFEEMKRNQREFNEELKRVQRKDREDFTRALNKLQAEFTTLNSEFLAKY